MNYLKFLALLAGFLLTSLVACHKESPAPVPNPGHIRFDDLAVGQRNKYLIFLGEGYYDAAYDQYAYTDDTLKVEIIAQDDKGFLVEESLDVVGEINDWLKDDRDSVYQYYIKIENDSLKFAPKTGLYLGSRLWRYWWSSKKGLPLAKIESPETEIKGWITTLPYCECYHQGFAKDYKLFGKNYERLNVIVDDQAMALDGPGKNIVYAPEYGLVRFVTYSWWTSTGIGWDLLP